MACAQLMGLTCPRLLDSPECAVEPFTVIGALPDFEQYLRVTKGLRPSCLANARSILRKLERHVQGREWWPPDVPVLVTEFLDTFHHPAYRYTAVYYLRLFFDFLGWAENPARQIKLPKVNQAQGRHFLSAAECRQLARVLDAAQLEGKHRREWVLFSLLLYTGIRIGEALALTWEDLAMDGALLIRDSKTHTGRVVYVPERVMAVLTSWRGAEGVGKGLIFPGAKPGTAISYSVVRTQFKRLLTAAGITRKGCNLHSLRHTYARACVEAGMPREIIQQFLGHKDIDTTAIYTRLWAQDVRRRSPEAHQAVDAFIGHSVPTSGFLHRRSVRRLPK